jgi:hypothetical protein
MKHSFNGAFRFIGAAGLVVLVGLSGCGRGGRVEGGPYVALGEVAAKATSGLLEGHGRIVLVVNETDNHTATALGQAVKVFNATLKKAGGVQVAATETIKAGAGPAISGAEPLAPTKFLELVTKHASADALVSFVGVPRLTPEQIGQLPQPRPKIVAAVTFNLPARSLFDQGVLHLAIVPQSGTEPAAKPPTTTQEWFDANYRLITPETAGALPF